MEDKNITNNLLIKQFKESDSIAYSRSFISQSSDYNFKILDNAYATTAQEYAKIKMLIKNNQCTTSNCYYENEKLKQLEQAPEISIKFLQNIVDELSVTNTSNYDVNNNYLYTVANCVMTGQPGFSKTDGYEVYLQLVDDGSQSLFFMGPMFENPLIINSSALESLLASGTSLVVETPNIQGEMTKLLGEVGLFSSESITEDGKLVPGATISEEFVLKNSDGSYDYEIVDISGGKGRNFLQYDMNKIKLKIDPFVNAEVAGLLSSEQSAVAAWNVYIGQGTSVDEDDQMVQDANAGSKAWSYEKDLPLKQDKKVLFEKKYKDYFMNNYLNQFIKNQFPTVKEDAAVFDLEEARTAKANKFLEDNNLN